MDTHDPELLGDETIALVAGWLNQAKQAETSADRRLTARLGDLIADPASVAFTMQFVDRVVRPDSNTTAAAQLAELASSRRALPSFLSILDRLLLRAGARLGRWFPNIVVPLARRRMRRLVGHLVLDADPEMLNSHLAAWRDEGYDLNVNLLGEAVLGQGEAKRRLDGTIELLSAPHIDYVSVKVSSIAAQLNYWAWDDSLDRVAENLRRIFIAAQDTATFVNLDMEEYHDLDLTIAAFTRVLDEPQFRNDEAGIALQAYLPDSFLALERLVVWASERKRTGGGEIKIRLVKGANLAMEKVDAALHGWEQAPYATKVETDANYKRCIDWVLTPERTRAVRIGIGSHNLFDIAWAGLLAETRGVADRVEIEMLQGMAPAHSRVLCADRSGVLLYTPVVRDKDFDVAIGYLFRRLEENSAEGNFLRILRGLEADTELFDEQVAMWRSSLAKRWAVDSGRRRALDRGQPREALGLAPFANDPETDPTLAANRQWAMRAIETEPGPVSSRLTTDTHTIDKVLAAARSAQPAWAARSPHDRRRILRDVADELARRRDDLLSALVHEGSKTIAQADPEICEAIDFARYYADRSIELEPVDGANFVPLGLVAVVSPWNFPVAIPAGGVFAALAAGNAVILKPAPETPRCAEIVAECCWAGGVPADVCAFVRTPDDHVGRRLVTTVDAVILTGSLETADLFKSWRPDMRLFAETSGKNAIVITRSADLDLAVADLVGSAFGHAGQKCSAASLAICVGDIYHSARFRRQLIDAVESLAVGPVANPATKVGPIVGTNPRLERALTELDAGEEWLVVPRPLDDAGLLWSPGVRLGVTAGSWFHRTECFGPVLGLMPARDLTEAIRLQNSSPYGLTGGIHSLDPSEVDNWLGNVEVGNAYVNRAITGAIVQRQPFGGWKGSSVGPGAKAGGPNYVKQLGSWHDDGNVRDEQWLSSAAASDERWWNDEFAIEQDPTGLFCEANRFGYRPLQRVGIRVGADAPQVEVDRVLAAADRCGVPVVLSRASEETEEEFGSRLASLEVERVRVVGHLGETLRVAAGRARVHLADEPVTRSGRIELLHYLREQSVSQTLHRFGNLVAVG